MQVFIHSLRHVSLFKLLQAVIEKMQMIDSPLNVQRDVTAASAGVTNCRVNVCCIILSMCTEQANHSAHSLTLCKNSVSVLSMSLCCVYFVLQKLKSLYFSFCNVFKGNRIFIVGNLLLWSEVSHQYLLT